MDLGIGLGLYQRRIGSGGGGGGSSPVTAVAADGWQATYPSPPTEFDPVGAPVTLAVTRQGFNAAGSAVTVNDTLTLMKRVRNPYSPAGAQNTLTADKVALSDFVYASDTLPAGVTNSSALAYPHPIACWLTPDLERVRTSTFTVRLAVAHAYARNGRPVAAVKFIATDGTNTVEQTVSTLSSRQWLSGQYSDYFECTLDTSTLNAATLCTVDAIIYPWVGTAFQASVHGSTYPSASFTVLKFLNDRAGTYGDAFAYVDPISGNNATAVVSATAATAAASPYLDISAAIAAIQTFNNATYTTRADKLSTSGGTIRLVPGVHTHVNFTVTAVGDTHLLIEGMGATRADTVWRDNGVTNTQGRMPGKLKLRNLTLRKTFTTSGTFLDNGATTQANLFVLDNVGMDLNGTTGNAAWLWRLGRVFALESHFIASTAASQSNAAKALTAVGCTGEVGGTATYNMIGCTSVQGVNARATVGSQTAANGQLVQHCFISNGAANAPVFNVSTTPIGPRGFAIIGNVVERWGSASATQPAFTIHADTEVQTVENMVIIGNTVVGERSNLLYQDTGTTTVAKRGFFKNTVGVQFNCKTDVFVGEIALPGNALAANCIGNWPFVFMVGHHSNATLAGSASVDTPGVGAWVGEVQALNSVNGSNAALVNPAWVDDRSNPYQSTGAQTGTGGGDYTPGAGSALPFIPAGMAPYSVDQKGRTLANNGTDRIGAIRQA